MSHGVYGREVLAPLLVADVDDALRSEEHPVASVAGGHHAVEHVHAAVYRLEDVHWSSHPHQITGFVLWKYAVHDFYHLVHHRGGKTADGIAVRTELLHELRRSGPQVGIGAPLYDGEERLSVVVFRRSGGIAFEAAFQPALGEKQRFCRIVVRRVAGGAFVECHHDIGSDRTFYIHDFFRRENMLAAIDMRTEFSTFFP